MRALILLESLVVVLLAAAILFGGSHPAGATAGGDIFPALNFLYDADPGETVRYSIDGGRSTLQFSVGAVDRGSLKGPPRLQIARLMTDTQGRPVPDEAPEYTHLPHRHGMFPFMAPEAPADYDRVWVLKRIVRESLPWHGKELRCWHVYCIDPGLPPDRDAVELWMHEPVPVFGILRWRRDGHTYDSDWNPK